MKKRLISAFVITSLLFNFTVFSLIHSNEGSVSKVYAGEIDPGPVLDIIIITKL